MFTDSIKIRSQNNLSGSDKQNNVIGNSFSINNNITGINNQIIIEIYFIRHGFSCGNFLKAVSPALLPKLLNFGRDPLLTNLGILQAVLAPYARTNAEDSLSTLSENCDHSGCSPHEKTEIKEGDRLSKLLEECDYHGCSTLSRAIETAFYCFGMSNQLERAEPAKNAKPIHIIPYISELTKTFTYIDVENYPLNWEDQKKRFESLNAAPYVTPMYDDEERKRYNNAVAVIGKDVPSVQMFLVYLERFILPGLLPKKKTVYKLAIVSHQNFIIKFLKYFRPKNSDVKYYSPWDTHAPDLKNIKNTDANKLSNLGIVKFTIPLNLLQEFTMGSIQKFYNKQPELIYRPNSIVLNNHTIQCYSQDKPDYILQTDARKKYPSRHQMNSSWVLQEDDLPYNKEKKGNIVDIGVLLKSILRDKCKPGDTEKIKNVLASFAGCGPNQNKFESYLHP